MPRIHVLVYAWPIAGTGEKIGVPLCQIDSDGERQIG